MDSVFSQSDLNAGASSGRKRQAERCRLHQHSYRCYSKGSIGGDRYARKRRSWRCKQKLSTIDQPLNQPAEKQGVKNIQDTVTKAESSHDREFKTREKLEHFIYGSDISPLSEKKPPPGEGTPAAEMLKQLNELRKQGKK